MNIEEMGKKVTSVFLSDKARKSVEELADQERRSLSQMTAILVEEALKSRGKEY